MENNLNLDKYLNIVNDEVTKKGLTTYVPLYPMLRVESGKLYISVMLTFLNIITPTVESISKIKKQSLYKDYKIDKLFKELKYDSPILFHLPQSMSNYIIVLTRQLVHIVGEDLKQIISSKNISDYEAGCLYNWYDEESDLDT